MFKINLNGIEFNVMTKEEKERCYWLKEDDFKEIDNNIYVYRWINRNKLYQSVGYDTNKIDFSIPQQMFDSKEIKTRMHCDNDRPCFYYGKYSRFGRLLWDNDVKELIFDNLMRKIEKKEYTEMVILSL